MSLKSKIFEYIAYRLNQWYLENNLDGKLNIMKLMRLLFLISGVDVDNNLFDVFRFQAWQYGHMEPEIFKLFSDNGGKFKNFEVSRNHFKWTSPSGIIPELDGEVKKRVDFCIDKLISEHQNTLIQDWYRLSELCKTYTSYKHYLKYDEWYVDMDPLLLTYESQNYY